MKCDTCVYGRRYEYEKPCIVYREDCPLYQKVGNGMTKEEIIKELSEMRTDAWTDTRQMEALAEGIKALEQEPIDKSAMMYEIYMEGVNMSGEYQGCWVRFKDIEKIVDKYMGDKE